MQKLRVQPVFIALSALTISGCTAGVTKTVAPHTTTINTPSAPVPQSTTELETVLGLNITQLKRRFGIPRLDVRETNGRKLQFSGKACIIDVYLYASEGLPATAENEVVTHIDARRSDGAQVDRASCVNALSQ